MLSEYVHCILVDADLAHAKDEVLDDGLVELADGAQVEHGVDGADGVPPLALVANSCLSRKNYCYHSNFDSPL